MSAWLSAFCRCRRSLSKLMLFAWFTKSHLLRCLIPKSKPPCLLGAPDDPWDFSALLHDTHQAYMKLSVCCGCLIVPFHHEQDLCLADVGVLMTRRTVWQLSRLLELRCELHGGGELPCASQTDKDFWCLTSRIFQLDLDFTSLCARFVCTHVLCCLCEARRGHSHPRLLVGNTFLQRS